MKHSVVLLSTTLTVLFLAQVCIAQEQQRNVLGVGMSIEPALFGGSTIYFSTDGYYYLDQQAYVTSPINIYVPINATSFRMEPAFGFYSFKDEWTTKIPGYIMPMSNKAEVTLTHLGLGVFYLIPTSNSVQMYVGPRIGINFVTTLSAESYYYSGIWRVQQEVKSQQTDFSVGLSFGAEYSPVSEFSIGAEVAANYVSFGNPEITRTPPSTSGTTERHRHIITTNTLFFLRWYFVKGTDEQ